MKNSNYYYLRKQEEKIIKERTEQLCKDIESFLLTADIKNPYRQNLRVDEELKTNLYSQLISTVTLAQGKAWEEGYETGEGHVPAGT